MQFYLTHIFMEKKIYMKKKTKYIAACKLLDI